ncbi:hypothetical protein DICSQDRAFT_171070 [Dichomitus squalens LYAD-421 SS1]|uniref:Uncharacterized protein n=1 Tax=Dichomitus squalens (strain LYAD-421) TaxID=732165 RepID=R7SY39_DICSQ|nr:uncharacterized protein DICSQDRAFT_171070 [Dichomitus squalens LYAD-421 SS1]EJF60630.1 hypothetical protein DICSQDRAFT_171070 [Dichomitus squalens LYAD-421 SS1]
MNASLDDSRDVPSRAPSRAGHRRPQLVRTNATRNAFPHLPPIKTTCPRYSGDVLIAGESGGGISTDSGIRDDREDLEFRVDLSPLCPPSPPSPISSSSESSTSSLVTPIDSEDWERFHDGFPPPPLLNEPPRRLWPPTPNPNTPTQPLLEGTDSHHGWSASSLFDLKRFWNRRHRVWWDYEEHCRHLQSYAPSESSSSPDEGNIEPTIYYPPPPVLLSSRATPWRGPNGISLETGRVATTTGALSLPRAPRLLVYPPWSPIFPRFGDIEDLRDPASEALDRMFLNFPPYAISRFLYFDQMVSQAEDLRARQRQRTIAPPPSSPSPSNELPVPRSPASIYSDGEDDGAFPGLSSMPTSNTTSSSLAEAGTSTQSRTPFGHLRWLQRWELLQQRFFPTLISPMSSSVPTPLSPPEQDSSFPIVPDQSPPRPGTPLPEDDESNATGCSLDTVDAHTSEQEEILVVRNDPESEGPRANTEHPVFQMVDHGRLSSSSDITVRLPSSRSRNTAHVGANSDAQAQVSDVRPLLRTLADEIEGAGVQFTVAPPPAVVMPRVNAPRFSFFAEESAFEFEEVGFDMDRLGPGIALEAVSC